MRVILREAKVEKAQKREGGRDADVDLDLMTGMRPAVVGRGWSWGKEGEVEGEKRFVGGERGEREDGEEVADVDADEEVNADAEGEGGGRRRQLERRVVRVLEALREEGWDLNVGDDG